MVVGCLAAPAAARPIASGVVTDPAGPGEIVATRALRSLAAEAGMTDLLDALQEWRADQPNVEQFEWFSRLFLRDWFGAGGADDLTIHQVWTIEGVEFRTVATLRAVDGATGKIEWTKRWTRPDDTIFIANEADVGRGEPGLIVTEVAGWGFGTTGIDYTFTALTSRGKKLWSRKFSSTIAGDYPFTYVATDHVVTAETFDGLPGKATDILIASGTVIVPPDWTLSSGAITSLVVDGRDGSIVNHPLPEIGAGFVPFAGAMDDFDRDGLDDYVFVNKRPNVAPGEDEAPLPVAVGTALVAARRGTDGFPLWTGGGIELSDHVQLENVGDVAGTEEGEVFVETQDDLFGSNETFTYMFEGAAGRLVWKRAGLWPYSPGDVDGDGTRDVLTKHYYSGEGFVAEKVRAYSGNGRRLWSREYRLENPLTGCCSWLIHWGGGWGVGDYDGDRASDGSVWLYAPGTGIKGVGDQVRQLVIDASSGEIHADGGEELQPLGSPPVDGGYADYARVHWAAGGVRIEVYDGASNTLLTSSELAFDVPLVPKKSYVYAESGRLNRDRCADVAVTVDGPGGLFEVMLDGSDGTILWWRSLGLRDGTVELAGSTDANEAC